MKLSYTAISLYKTCPRRYDFKYNDKIRDLRLSSALFFGGKLGNVFEDVLNAKKDGKELPDPYEIYNKKMETVQLANGEEVSLPTCEYIRYYANDLEWELLEPEDYDLIERMKEHYGFTWKNEEIDDWVKSKAYKKDMLSDDQYIFANFIYYLSLRRKGLKLIDRFMSDFLPKVVKVHSLEKEIRIENGGGDHIIGYSDLICDLEHDGNTYYNVLLDFKTSSSLYPADSVVTSEQLSFYNFKERVEWCAYVVFLKKATKKDGYRMQIVIDRIPKEQILSVVGEADEILTKIEEKQFDKDPKGCYSFGSLCEYWSLCQLGTSSKFNFINKDETNEN